MPSREPIEHEYHSAKWCSEVCTAPKSSWRCPHAPRPTPQAGEAKVPCPHCHATGVTYKALGVSDTCKVCNGEKYVPAPPTPSAGEACKHEAWVRSPGAERCPDCGAYLGASPQLPTPDKQELVDELGEAFNRYAHNAMLMIENAKDPDVGETYRDLTAKSQAQIRELYAQLYNQRFEAAIGPDKGVTPGAVYPYNNYDHSKWNAEARQRWYEGGSGK